MPSTFDNTYHSYYRKPVFDDAQSEDMWQSRRESDEVLEVRPAPLPTREQELEYMDWLKNDLKSDPWVTYRFRKYTANPKRVPWKNSRQLKRQYQFTFMCNWALGSFLAWPLAAAIGRRYKVTGAGVPVVHMPRAVHDFPKMDPGFYARTYFRWYAGGACLLLGYAFARVTIDHTQKQFNSLYNRPDLKPKAAMVDDASDDRTNHMLEQQYVPLQGRGDESSIRRFLFPRAANFEIKENLYQKYHPDDVWNHKTRIYTTYSDNFGAHQA